PGRSGRGRRVGPGQLRGGRLDRLGRRPPPPGPGPRHPRRPRLGGRRAPAAGQLRLRLLQGGHGRLLHRPRRRTARQRREGHRRAARLRAHADDGGHGIGTLRHHAGGGGRRRRRRAGLGRGDGVGAVHPAVGHGGGPPRPPPAVPEVAGMKTDPRADWEAPVHAPDRPDECEVADVRLWEEFDAVAAVDLDVEARAEGAEGAEGAAPAAGSAEPAEPPAPAAAWQQLRLWEPGKPASAPAPARTRRGHRRPASRWFRRTRRAVLAGFLVMAVIVGYSIVAALRAPGTESAVARLAEWARDHHGTPLVNWA